MKQFLSVFILSLLFINCKAPQKVAKTNNVPKVVLQNSYPVSNRTKMFIAELQRELNTSGKNLEDFIPSSKMIDEYAIRKADHQYFISGFIKVGQNFNEAPLKEIGVSIGSRSGSIYTIQIPMSSFAQFLNQTDIVYFEISTKVSLN